MRIVIRTLGAAILLFVITGCSDQVTQEQGYDPVVVGSYFSFGKPDFVKTSSSPKSPDHAATWSRLIMESNEIVRKAESVEAANLALRAVAAKTDDAMPPHVAEQARSRALLAYSGVFDQPHSAANIELVRTHLGVLVQNNSPEARLGLQAIEYLQGEVTEAELKQAANTIGTAAMEALSEECHMCEVARTSKPDLYRGLMDYFDAERQAATMLLSY